MFDTLDFEDEFILLSLWNLILLLPFMILQSLTGFEAISVHDNTSAIINDTIFREVLQYYPLLQMSYSWIIPTLGLFIVGLSSTSPNENRTPSEYWLIPAVNKLYRKLKDNIQTIVSLSYSCQNGISTFRERT